jgi:hypothetical protein
MMRPAKIVNIDLPQILLMRNLNRGRICDLALCFHLLGAQAYSDSTSWSDLNGHRVLCSSCVVSRAKATPFMPMARCEGCGYRLNGTPATLISVDLFLNNLRYKLYTRIMKDDDAMSMITVIVHNWPHDSVVSYMQMLEVVARGSPDDEA